LLHDTNASNTIIKIPALFISIILSMFHKVRLNQQVTKVIHIFVHSFVP